MNCIRKYGVAILCLAAITSASTAKAAIVASHDFDTPTNLVSQNGTPAFNSFPNAGDGWGIYNFAGGGPFGLFDDSVVGSGGGASFPTDDIGIVQSTKADNFFGIIDTVNGDNPGGSVTGDFIFDISAATTGLGSVEIDFAAMGDFEASSDTVVISYSIDGGAFTDIFTSSVDEAANRSYTMEDGDVFVYDDPMAINGTELGNFFQTISAPISGTGAQLTLRVFAELNGGDEPFGFDNIVINDNVAIPEPSSLALVCLGGLVFARRRRS